jgi:putative Ca2+/H+ antiporter (TMEM165/GDT1 family)
MTVLRSSILATLCLAIAAGCARPYRGSKTLGALGVGLLATSAALWVVGERGDRDQLAKVGAISSAAGTALVIGAGAWLAASATCNVDPDCPDDEVCREIPAPPGREPYRQCSPR